MPNNNGVGTGPHTQIKQFHFAKIIAMHLSIADATMRKWPKRYEQTYYFVDATAGPGRYPDEQGTIITGSPVIFIQQAERLEIPYHADFIEERKDNLDELKKHIQVLNHGDVSFLSGRYEDVLPRILKYDDKKLGLFYVDTTGNAPDLDAISLMSERRPKAEILICIGATLIKRGGKLELKHILNAANKGYWLIREPRFKEQWTFLLGTNTDLFKNYNGIGFYRCDNPHGEKILDYLNEVQSDKKKAEIAAAQKLQLPLIGLIENTLDIPNSLKSEQKSLDEPAESVNGVANGHQPNRTT